MCSRPERPRAVARALLLAGWLAACAVSQATPTEVPRPAATASAADPPPRTASTPNLDAVRATIAAMRAESSGGVRIEHRLQWRGDDTPPPERGNAEWLVALARWLADASRWIVWLLGALGVALLALFAWRWMRVRGDAARGAEHLRPSHVNDLDIRPASLPADIGAAARALLHAGQPRAALSLLYRGTLSRLVHAHRLPIGAASTEGECARLARNALVPAASDYVAALLQAWQWEVYADRRNDPGTIEALCSGFDAALAPPTAHTAPAVAAAAGVAP